jgi:hypothetical protein
MDTRVERIVLETERHRITGDLTMPREGYRSRLSDYLNRGEVAFVPLADAVVSPLDGVGSPDRRDFLAVGRNHVRIAYFEGDGRDSG